MFLSGFFYLCFETLMMRILQLSLIQSFHPIYLRIFPERKHLIITGMSLLISFLSHAQFQISTHFDFGENNVSEGIFIKNSYLGIYQFGKNKISGGCQFDLISRGTNFLTGSNLKVSRDFTIKEFPFEIQGLFMYNPFSELVRESIWGALVKIQRKHFVYQLGTNFRTYKVTGEAVDDYDQESDNKIRENWNLMYLLQYNLHPPDHKWNMGVSLTNIDHFIINQETNPVLYLHGHYTFTAPVTLYIESWFKNAGAFNISSNYFGFFFRTGILWKLDIKKQQRLSL